MEIYFRNKKLEKLCNNTKVMKNELGDRMSKKLQQRLVELKAASNLEEISHMPPSRLHKLNGNRNGQFSVDLLQPYRLLFIVANDPLLNTDINKIDKSKVTEIEIIELVDLHWGEHESFEKI